MCAGLGGCFGRSIADAENGDDGELPAKGGTIEIEAPGSGNSVPNELVGLFDSEREAKECAKLYGIELISYSYEVAVFRYDGDIDELLAKGEENGWPELSRNHMYQAFD